MTSDTLSDMNRVAFYFQSLVAKIKQADGKGQDQGLHHLVVVLSQHFDNLLQTEKNFMDRISNCQANFSALNQVVNRNVNKAENTLKTIQGCLNHGTIQWVRKNEKFNYRIKTTLPDSTNPFDVTRRATLYEESKNANKRISVQSVQQQHQDIVYSQEEITQHCSRAILLIHSRKTDPKQK